MTPTTKTTTDIKKKQCDHCHVPECSSHPIGNFIVNLEPVSPGGEERLLCSRCRLYSEIKAQKPSTVDHSTIWRMKHWRKGMKQLLVTVIRYWGSFRITSNYLYL